MNQERVIELAERLQQKADKVVSLKINNNRQTMLSVKWESDVTKVSLHRIFLQAPPHVMEALACYIGQGTKGVSYEIKAFIENSLAELDYSHLIDSRKLEVEGRVYNLSHIFNEINKKYFKNDLTLKLTWFGHVGIKNKSRCTLGLYYDSLKLIKIHRLLDQIQVPAYVIEFVIFHEMVHAVCPAYLDDKGVHRIHNSRFKQMERTFYAYEKADQWIKDNRATFFKFR